MESLRVESAEVAALWRALLDLRSHLRDSDTSAGDLFFVRDKGEWRLSLQAPATDAVEAVFIIVDRPITDDEIERSVSGPRIGLFSQAHFQAGRNPIHLHPLHVESVFAPSAFEASGDQSAATSFAVDPDETAIDARAVPTTPVRNMIGRDMIGRGAISCFRLYLPMILGGARANRLRRSFVTAHLAQSLDGRIACLNGHSQWISGDEDLRHSHRLRALHDGVLVGGGTVLRDDPQLTVRHVEGRSPTRLILNASASVLESKKSYQVFEGPASVLLCSRRAQASLGDESRSPIPLIPFDLKDDATIDPIEIRQELFRRGIRSIFLEGGAGVFSSFLHSGCIDLLHLAVAPLILGSGISSLSLPEIYRVQEGIRVRTTPFYLDQDLLLECRLPGNESELEP